MAKYLIVEDYQKDFVATVHAQQVYSNIKNKLIKRISEGWQVIFTYDTYDTNYRHTIAGRNLPVIRCVEGTPGWEIYGSLLLEVKEALKAYNCTNENASWQEESGPLLVLTNTFDYIEWKYLIPDAEEIEVIGGRNRNYWCSY